MVALPHIRSGRSLKVLTFVAFFRVRHLMLASARIGSAAGGHLRNSGGAISVARWQPLGAEMIIQLVRNCGDAIDAAGPTF